MNLRETSASGLTEADVRERLASDGPNELPSSRPRNVLRLLREILTEPMFLLLVGCGGIYLLLGDRQEAMMLLGFVVVVMGITFVQERRTERSLEALRDLSVPRALVVRDGSAQRIAGRDLVRGDTVLLAEGDRVPADMHLLEASNLAVDESMLTGESAPVAKRAQPQVGMPGEQSTRNDATSVFSGTLVTQGTARGEVFATGSRSAMGRIGSSLAALGSESTPIQIETRRVVKVVATVGLGLAALLALTYGVTRGDWLHAVLAGLTLAMAIIPEELPVVLTLFLGMGAWRLSREGVLARSVPAVELLGATTVLCVDKTGTLTRNHMAVRRLWNGESVVEVSGAVAASLPEPHHALLEYAVLASHRRAFDPMEQAIVDAGQRLLTGTEHLHGDWTLVDDYPLAAELLAMSRVWRSADSAERMIASKGAPEAIVDLCHLPPAEAGPVLEQVSRMAAQGLRVLAVARAVFAEPSLPRSQHDFDFRFMGLVGLEDPVRDDVPDAITECREAGIRVVMITGDHPQTALSIARQAGLEVTGHAITGAELESMTDDALRHRLPGVNVFCRVKPEHKLRIVQAFRANGEIVAMTGDGVNDAPALKAAHIGVAMGARGTDVAREAGSLVLLKDDFSSLVKAVRYGRRIFANLRKAFVFVIAVHVPIVGLSVIPVLAGWPLVLLPAHILFLQLIIDPSCSLVFEAEEAERDAMKVRPRSADTRLFDVSLLLVGSVQGLGLLVVLLVLHAWARVTTGSDDIARTATFVALVLSNVTLIQVNRSSGTGAWRNRLSSNRYFIGMALFAVALLGLVLGVPVLSRLFSLGLPSAPILASSTLAVAVCTAWFESAKKVAACLPAKPWRE